MKCRARDSALPILLFFVVGCGRADRLPTAVTTPPGVGISSTQLDRAASDLQAHGWVNFYPMAVGNRWRYASSDTKVFISYDGTRIVKHGEGKTEIVQVRMEQLHGRMYMREEIGIPDTVLAGGGVRWRREDPTGLYEFGPEPPGAPPFSEARLLAYPLHVGASWEMFPGSRLRVTATVEGMDVADFPAGRFPAWRIRISGPEPRNQIAWYGRAGYLGSKAHDDSGPPSDPRHVQIIYDHVDSLTALRLVSHVP